MEVMNNQAVLFAMLEPTPIDEHAIAKSNRSQPAKPSNQTLQDISVWASNHVFGPLTAYPSYLLAQQEDQYLKDLSSDEFLANTLQDGSPWELPSEEPDSNKIKNNTSETAALPKHDLTNSGGPPCVNDFLTLPWFQEGRRNDDIGGLKHLELFKALSYVNIEGGLMRPMPAPSPQNQMQQQKQHATMRPVPSSLARSISMSRLRSESSITANQDSITYMPAPMGLLSDGTASMPSKKGRAPHISDSQSIKWMERYNELWEFKKLHDHCCIPSYWPANTRLAQWVKRQRYQYKLQKEERQDRSSTLTEERIQLLTNLGFVWDSHGALWEERWNEVKQFRDMYGHANVPTKNSENPALGIWCKCQRRQFKMFCTKGPTKSYLTGSRIAKLMEIGFVFDPRANAKKKQQANS